MAEMVVRVSAWRRCFQLFVLAWAGRSRFKLINEWNESKCCPRPPEHDQVAENDFALATPQFEQTARAPSKLLSIFFFWKKKYENVVSLKWMAPTSAAGNWSNRNLFFLDDLIDPSSRLHQLPFALPFELIDTKISDCVTQVNSFRVTSCSLSQEIN